MTETEQAQEGDIGDTVRLTIEGKVYESFGGWLMVDGTLLKGTNRTVEILSRAIPPLPSEPGTWWLDNDKFDDVWHVDNDGVLRCVTDTNLRNAQAFAPFRQLVLK